MSYQHIDVLQSVRTHEAILDMKVVGIEWRGVRVPFREPFITSAGAAEERCSLLLWLHTDGGVTGIGEAPASLVTGDVELKELVSTLHDLSPSLLGMPLEGVSRWAGERLKRDPEGSVLRFALETAAYDALGQWKGLPVARLLGGRPRPVPVNAIIGVISPRRASTLAARAVAEGFTTIKLKVGGRPIGEDEAMLDVVRNAIGGDIRLRLDANQAWDLEEAKVCLHRLARFDPEYVEEPLKGGETSDLVQLRRATDTPIAADESVNGREAAGRIIEAWAADILVVKAARVGGLGEARAIVQMATSNGLRAIITSSLETGVGLAASLHLAEATLGETEVCGLATGRLLEHDLLTTRILPDKGFIPPLSLPGLGISIDKDALDRYGTGLKGRLDL